MCLEACLRRRSVRAESPPPPATAIYSSGAASSPPAAASPNHLRIPACLVLAPLQPPESSEDNDRYCELSIAHGKFLDLRIDDLDDWTLHCECVRAYVLQACVGVSTIFHPGELCFATSEHIRTLLDQELLRTRGGAFLIRDLIRGLNFLLKIFNIKSIYHF